MITLSMVHKEVDLNIVFVITVYNVRFSFLDKNCTISGQKSEDVIAALKLQLCHCMQCVNNNVFNAQDQPITPGTLRYFCINHGYQRFFFQFEIIINHPLYSNTYVMGLRPIYIFLIHSVRGLSLDNRI